MIVLEARININNTAESGTIDSVYETNAKVQSNISAGEPIKDGSGNVAAIDLSSVVNDIKPSINPYRLDYSVLDSGALFWDEKSFYIGGVLSAREQSSDGSYSFGTPYRFEINTASGIAFFGVMFDSLNINYPTEIIVDGVPYANDSGIFYAFNLDKTLKSHTVEISKFSAPYAPLQIQGLFSDIEIVVDNQNGLSIDIDIDDREDNKKPSFGVVSNSGSLSFIDSKGVVKNLIDSKLINTQKSVVSVSVINKVTKSQNLLNIYKIQDINYNNLNYEVNVTLTDLLSDMQNVNFKGVSPESFLHYPSTISDNGNLYSFQKYTSAKTIYNAIRNIGADKELVVEKAYDELRIRYYDYEYNGTSAETEKFNIADFDELDEITKELLKTNEINTTAKYSINGIVRNDGKFYINSSSLWNVWDKFCKAFCCHMYFVNGKAYIKTVI